MNAAPYTFAVRATVFVAALAASIAAADRIVAAASARGVQFVPKVPPPEYVSLLQCEGRVALFGDSVLTNVAEDEQDRTTLARRIAQESPTQIVDRSRPGRGPDLSAAEIVAMTRLSVRPRAVVFEVNLRNFSPAWEGHPLLQERQIVAACESGWFLPIRAAAVFKYRFGAPTADEFLNRTIVVNGRALGSMRDLERPRPWFPDDRGAPPDLERTRSLVRYAFDLDASDWLRRMERSLRLLADGRVPTVAFLTPIDFESLRRLLSDEEMAAVERNVARLREVVAATRVTWADLSHDLATSSFIKTPLFPDEHLRADGRRRVATRIGELLRTAEGR